MDYRQFKTIVELDAEITNLSALLKILEISMANDGLPLLIAKVSSKKRAVSEGGDYSTVVSPSSLGHHAHEAIFEAFSAAVKKEFEKKKAEFHGIEINVPGYNEGAD
jgi:hypothetical protein